MFTAGIGQWLYEGALGLHFRYTLTSGNAPPRDDDDACLYALGLGIDAVRLGFSRAQVQAMCVVVKRALVMAADGEPTVAFSLENLLYLSHQYPSPDPGVDVDAVLTGVLTVKPSAAIMRALGSKLN
jgi:hypothetical protein